MVPAQTAGSMKILDIVQFYSPLSGGVKRYIHGKMRFLAERSGHEHAVIVPSDRFAVSAVWKSRIYELRCLPLPGSRSYRMLVSERHIATVVAEERPDLIEVDNPYRAAWIARGIGHSSGIPVVAYYHSDFPRIVGRLPRDGRRHPVRRRVGVLINAYLRRLYGGIDATIVATDRMRDALRAMGIPRLETIPLGADLDVFIPRASRGRVLGRYEIDPAVRLLLYVGRLAREKNVLQLVGMMDRLPRHTNAHLMIVGDGELRRLIQQAAAARTDLTWVPYIEDPDELADYYAASDLLVHPGNSETFCLAAIEAQACGTRVVAVRDGGADHAVTGDTPPILAASHGVDDLAEAVARALSLGEGPDARHARRRRMLETYTADAAYTRLLRFYERVVAAARAAATGKPTRPEEDRAAHRSAIRT